MTRNLNAAQAERYQPWFDNSRRLRELISELEALSVRAAIEDEQWEGSKCAAPDLPAQAP